MLALRLLVGIAMGILFSAGRVENTASELCFLLVLDVWRQLPDWGNPHEVVLEACSSAEGYQWVLST
jgi:hypothetical protein